jgi:nicotinamide riboside kinase
MKKLIRKRQHMIFVRRYIVDLQWDSLNTILVASKTQWNDDIIRSLDNNGKLIRKYERRKRWLKF